MLILKQDQCSIVPTHIHEKFFIQKVSRRKVEENSVLLHNTPTW